MSQTKLQSAYEQVMNQMIGNVLAWSMNYFLLPLFGMPQSMGRATLITIIFSVVSFIRGYMIRRFFNWLADSPLRDKHWTEWLIAQKKFEPKVVPVILLNETEIASLSQSEKCWLLNWAGFYKIHETIEPVVAQYVYRSGPDEGKIRIHRNGKASILVSKVNLGSFYRKFKKIEKIEEATRTHRSIISKIN